MAVIAHENYTTHTATTPHADSTKGRCFTEFTQHDFNTPKEDMIESCLHPGSTRPCTMCLELDQFCTDRLMLQQENIEPPRRKLKQQNVESLDAKYTKLNVEKNVKIEQLRKETERVKGEDDEVRAASEKREQILKSLESEIKQLRPVQAFVIKEKKWKKK